MRAVPVKYPISLFCLGQQLQKSKNKFWWWSRQQQIPISGSRISWKSLSWAISLLTYTMARPQAPPWQTISPVSVLIRENVSDLSLSSSTPKFMTLFRFFLLLHLIYGNYDYLFQRSFSGDVLICGMERKNMLLKSK